MLFALGGHWFPGYQLDSTADAGAGKVAASAVGDVMAEICAERFMDTTGLESRLAALNGAGSDWSKASYIRDGTWANAPDGEQADYSTAEKCRGLIAEEVSKQPVKTS